MRNRSRRHPAVVFLALLLGAARAVPAPAPAVPASRPNIIFILADDLGYGDLDIAGGPRSAGSHAGTDAHA